MVSFTCFFCLFVVVVAFVTMVASQRLSKQQNTKMFKYLLLVVNLMFVVAVGR